MTGQRACCIARIPYPLLVALSMNDVWTTTQELMIDTDPDIFYYNFNGISGKFFFKEDGTIVLNKHDGIKVNMTMLVTPVQALKAGSLPILRNKYYFGKNKAGTVSLKTSGLCSYTSQANSSSQSSISSFEYYLLEAKDMNEENTMTYNYQLYSGAWSGNSGGFVLLYGATSGCSGFNVFSDQTSVATSAGEYLLSSIKTNNGSIIFNSSADRLELLGQENQ